MLSGKDYLIVDSTTHAFKFKHHISFDDSADVRQNKVRASGNVGENDNKSKKY